MNTFGFVERFEAGSQSIYLEYGDDAFSVGETRIQSGPFGLHAPSVTLTNREEVLAADPGTVVARLQTTEGTIAIVPRGEMKKFAS